MCGRVEHEESLMGNNSEQSEAILGFNWHFSSSSLTRSWPKNSNISTMVYGMTVRLAGMKALVVTKQQCTNCIGSPREQMLHWDIRKTRISPEGRHNSYQTYWYDSSTCEQPTAENYNCTVRPGAYEHREGASNCHTFVVPSSVGDLALPKRAL